MNKYLLIFFAAVGAILGGGCLNMAPDYERPEAPLPEAWSMQSAADIEASQSGDQSAPAGLAWEAFYQDSTLQELIALAMDNNRDLRLAVKNLNLAAALHGIEENNLYPALYATGGAAWQKQSAHLLPPGQPRRGEAYNVNIGVLSWEPDFFGRIKNMSDEALEQFLAAAENCRGARVLVTSSVANAYLLLVADRESLALANATLQTQQDAFDLIKRQYDEGLATELTLRQAQVTVETARGDIACLKQQVRLDQNTLELLLGMPLPTSASSAKLADVQSVAEITPGLPSELLLNRPDIMAAEHRLKAANAFVGVARAAFFPSISLTAMFGSASNELSGLFKGGSSTWSFAPQVTMPIFDSRVWAAHRASKAQSELVLADYERVIQQAFKEVNDVLAVRGTIGEQLEAQEALVGALAEAHRLAHIRYDQGIDSYLNVLDAQRNLFQAQQGLISLRLLQATNKVQLYAVLGGGGE